MEKKEYKPPTITVLLLPAEKEFEMPRPKTGLSLLNKLGIKQGTALIIRGEELLTPDRAILNGDSITVKIVTSSG